MVHGDYLMRTLQQLAHMLAALFGGARGRDPTNAAAAEEVFQSFRAAERVRLFDGWAEHYDRSTGDAEGFPFEGYERVLDEVVRAAGASAGMTVLDLGIGTGNLAARFAGQGCDLWGIDSSREMLAKARDKVPSATLVLADLLGVWPGELERRFDRIVSSYLFHEFDLATKVRLLRRLAERNLAPGGHIVVGDVGFATSREREAAHAKWADAWDDDEHYWAADEAQEACRGAGLRVGYRQVSSCAGVFVFEPATPERAGAGDG